MNTADLAKVVTHMLRDAGISSVTFKEQQGSAFLFGSGEGVEIRILDVGNGHYSVALRPQDRTAVQGVQQRSIRRALHDAAERWLTRE